MTDTTEQAVLTDARDALNRYAERLPADSPWREAFEHIGDKIARSIAVNEASDAAGAIIAKRRREREQAHE